MAIIPERFMNAVVAIGIDQFDIDGKRVWIGSGFIVKRKELQNSNFSTYYIITNKHVIRNFVRYICVLIHLAELLLRTIILISMIIWGVLYSLLIPIKGQILLRFNLLPRS